MFGARTACIANRHCRRSIESESGEKSRVICRGVAHASRGQQRDDGGQRRRSNRWLSSSRRQARHAPHGEKAKQPAAAVLPACLPALRSSSVPSTISSQEKWPEAARSKSPLVSYTLSSHINVHVQTKYRRTFWSASLRVLVTWRLACNSIGSTALSC